MHNYEIHKFILINLMYIHVELPAIYHHTHRTKGTQNKLFTNKYYKFASVHLLLSKFPCRCIYYYCVLLLLIFCKLSSHVNTIMYILTFFDESWFQPDQQFDWSPPNLKMKCIYIVLYYILLKLTVHT